MARDRRQEIEIGDRSGDPGFVQRPTQAHERLRPVLTPGDQLGQQGVVVNADGVAHAHAGIYAHLRPLRWRPPVGDAPARRQEVTGRILGIEPHLDGVAGDRQRVLRTRQGLAGGHPELPFHQVLPGNHLGNGMLHLQAGVHLHEGEAAVAIEQELHRAGADIADGAGGRDRGRRHRRPQLRREAGGRRLLHHLLVPALEGAVALEHVHHIAVAVGEDLDLDVAWPLQIGLEQHPLVAEGAGRLALGGGEGGGEILGALDHAHALATAAGDRLDEHRKADLRRRRCERLGRLAGVVRAAQHGHAGLFHGRLGGGLVAHGADDRRRRADEDQPRLGAGGGEVGVLGQEAVAGMHRLRPAPPRGGENGVNFEIAVARRCRPYAHRVVRHLHMKRALVGIGIDGDRAHAQPPRRAQDAAGDLSPVGDQQGLEHAPRFAHPLALTCGRRRSAWAQPTRSGRRRWRGPALAACRRDR